LANPNFLGDLGALGVRCVEGVWLADLALFPSVV
jgi:hypothetical protein